MPKSIPAYINPKILKWARETSGFSVERISEKMKINLNKFKKIEDGHEKLSVSQLRKIAKIYKRPIPVFYLKKIPENVDLPDFRVSILPIDVEQTVQSLNIKLREINEMRKNAISINNQLKFELDYSFIDELRKIEDNTALSQKILEILNITRKNLSKKRDNEVLNFWKERIEQKNILVFQFQNIPPEEIRGFVIADQPFPTIALNQKETYYARVFTLIHEFCHIILNRSGKCDANPLFPVNDDLERNCNLITSLILVPSIEIESEWKKAERQEMEIPEIMSTLSNHFRVSWSVVLYRLRELDIINNKNFSWVMGEIEKKRREYTSRSSGGGGDYYNNYLSRTSNLYLRLVYKSLDQNLINYYQALKFTGLKFETFKTAQNKFLLGGR